MKEPEDLSGYYPLEPLTWREEEILALLIERRTNREIAQSLHISPETVKWYNQRLFAKLGVKNRRDAAAVAEKLGLLDIVDKDRDDFGHNLPAQATPFVGRQRELGELLSILNDKNNRLITLLAPGGMGKTRLAIKAAEQHVTQFADGAIFVPLKELESEDHLASAIAESMSLHLQIGGNPRRQLLQYLRKKELLILLDSFEYALGAARFVGDMLQTAPDIKVLATSRERLKLSGETIYPISGMSIPNSDKHLKELEKHGAINLFIQSAKHVHPTFEVQKDDWEPIVHICQLVDGMPLGIVLAATWVRVLSPGEIADEITGDLDLLSTDMHDIPPRQRSIRAVFASTWRRLSDTVKRAFEKLTVFKGGFTFEAAQAIAFANLPTIQLLADRGILQRTASGRFEIHELLRQFAEEKLQQSDAVHASLDAHSRYYAKLLSDLEVDLRSRQQAAVLISIEEDIENIQSAWRYAVNQKNSAIVSEMVAGLYFFYETRGWFEEGEAAFNRAAVSFSAETQTNEGALLLGRLLARQGAFAHRLGRYQHAAQILKASLSSLRSASAREESAFTLSFMADLSRSLGRYEASKQLCKESLTLYKETNDKWGIAGELHNLGVASYHLGDFDGARSYYYESLLRSRELKDQHGIVTSLIGIGALEQDLGNFPEAHRFYSESLAISESLDDRYGVAASLINLGRVYYLTGDLKAGQKSCQEGLEICRDLGDRWGMAAAWINLGDIACELKKFEDSRAHFRLAWQIVAELQSEPLTVEILVGVAGLLAEMGKYEAAMELMSAVMDQPPDDVEIRERANQLQEQLESRLPRRILMDIHNREKGITIEDAAGALTYLL